MSFVNYISVKVGEKLKETVLHLFVLPFLWQEEKIKNFLCTNKTLTGSTYSAESESYHLFGLFLSILAKMIRLAVL